jgi:hypothetical protein
VSLVHILADASESLSSECLPQAFTDAFPGWSYAICAVTIMVRDDRVWNATVEGCGAAAALQPPPPYYLMACHRIMCLLTQLHYPPNTPLPHLAPARSVW